MTPLNETCALFILVLLIGNALGSGLAYITFSVPPERAAFDACYMTFASAVHVLQFSWLYSITLEEDAAKAYPPAQNACIARA